MRTVKGLVATICTAMAVFVFSPAANAQEPHYLQALGELRTARDYISYDHGKFDDQRRHAVDEINKAIEEIKHAAWDDGKTTKFAPPGSATNGWAPMHYAGVALQSAQRHVSEGVDRPENEGLRKRAMTHIIEASEAVKWTIDHGAP